VSCHSRASISFSVSFRYARRLQRLDPLPIPPVLELVQPPLQLRRGDSSLVPPLSRLVVAVVVQERKRSGGAFLYGVSAHCPPDRPALHRLPPSPNRSLACVHQSQSSRYAFARRVPPGFRFGALFSPMRFVSRGFSFGSLFVRFSVVCVSYGF